EINTVAVLSFANSSSGLIADNRFVANTGTGLLARVADDMTFINNFLTNTDGDEFSGAIESGAASITASPAND
ncbi:MAG: hypothetical protein ACYSWP_20975, partial [Planctomycetota bacterium]